MFGVTANAFDEFFYDLFTIYRRAHARFSNGRIIKYLLGVTGLVKGAMP